MNEPERIEIEAAEARKRESRARQLLDRIMREIRNESTSVECPCCCGRGRLEILLGARDDEGRR